MLKPASSFHTILPLMIVFTFLIAVYPAFSQAPDNSAVPHDTPVASKPTVAVLSTPPVDSSATEGSDNPTGAPVLSDFEVGITTAIIIFGVSVLLMEFLLIKAGKIPTQDSIKIIVVTLIIISTLILITAGYSNNQVAPAVGLLGTIAGYLLGKNSSDNKTDNHENPNPKSSASP